MTDELQTKPLKYYVDITLREYLAKLNDSMPNDLYNMVLHEVEQPLLHLVMEFCGGNQSKAAEALGLNRATLRKKLKQHNLL